MSLYCTLWINIWNSCFPSIWKPLTFISHSSFCLKSSEELIIGISKVQRAKETVKDATVPKGNSRSSGYCVHTCPYSGNCQKLRVSSGWLSWEAVQVFTICWISGLGCHPAESLPALATLGHKWLPKVLWMLREPSDLISMLLFLVSGSRQWPGCTFGRSKNQFFIYFWFKKNQATQGKKPTSLLLQLSYF